MEWTQWLPLIAGIIALLGVWGAIQNKLGRLESRIDSLDSRMERLERQRAEDRAENIRLHEETRAEFRREIRFVLQAMREHTHADGSPASSPCR